MPPMNLRPPIRLPFATTVRPTAVFSTGVLAALLFLTGCTGVTAPPTTTVDVAEPMPAAEATPAETPPAIAPTAPEDAPEATAAPPGDAGSAARATCYYGPVRERGAQTPGTGDGTPTADLLLRRTLQPAASRIVEESVRFDRTPGGRPRPYTVVLDVDGDSLTLTESEQRFHGTGTLHGEPWHWDSWDVDYTLTSGIRVEASCALGRGDDGEPLLRCQRTAYGPDGAAALHLGEELHQISMAECEQRFSAVRLPAG